ncbi:uracil-DNA glycosylase family protein [Streptobacillus felis]|uniref:Uracil-DNA glycosylase-like domain-containing protein n=1 Tax=Streptobacillus felis TaxID=1384509 RepID=A0A7Z0T8B0_9FUSO|nr:uracil-DNA glycosylase family protein [Streptobacillus felis]NYV27769.1 hypothetical protein [Streptobacillus felis]
MWKELEYRIRTLDVYRNYKENVEIMQGMGNKNANIMLILNDVEKEAFENENILESNKGRVVKNIFNFVGINLDEIYITSLYKLEKSNIIFNSNTTDELLDVLITEIMLVNPKYIITVGEEVFNVLISDSLGKDIKKNNVNINKCVGNIYNYFNKVLVPIYDIQYITKSKKEEKMKIVEVLKLIKENE